MTGWAGSGSGRSFGRARGGNVVILVALGSSLLMGAGAVGIDLGQVFQARRKAQGAADIAAMLAAVDPARPTRWRAAPSATTATTPRRATVATGGYDASAPNVAPGVVSTLG